MNKHNALLTAFGAIVLAALSVAGCATPAPSSGPMCTSVQMACGQN